MIPTQRIPDPSYKHILSFCILKIIYRIHRKIIIMPTTKDVNCKVAAIFTICCSEKSAISNDWISIATVASYFNYCSLMYINIVLVYEHKQIFWLDECENIYRLTYTTVMWAAPVPDIPRTCLFFVSVIVVVVNSNANRITAILFRTHFQYSTTPPASAAESLR